MLRNARAEGGRMLGPLLWLSTLVEPRGKTGPVEPERDPPHRVNSISYPVSDSVMATLHTAHRSHVPG